MNICLKKDASKRASIRVSDDKFVSVSFPFNVHVDKKKKIAECVFDYADRSKLKPGEKTRPIVNYLTDIGKFIHLSEKTINLKGKVTERYKFTDTVDLIDSLDSVADEAVNLVEQLLTHESGYIRYDHDKKVISPSHPEHHFDVNIENRAKFKFGIDNALSFNDFILLFDKDAKCQYPRFERIKKDTRKWLKYIMKKIRGLYKCATH